MSEKKAKENRAKAPQVIVNMNIIMDETGNVVIQKAPAGFDLIMAALQKAQYLIARNFVTEGMAGNVDGNLIKKPALIVKPPSKKILTPIGNA